MTRFLYNLRKRKKCFIDMTLSFVLSFFALQEIIYVLFFTGIFWWTSLDIAVLNRLSEFSDRPFVIRFCRYASVKIQFYMIFDISI